MLGLKVPMLELRVSLGIGTSGRSAHALVVLGQKLMAFDKRWLAALAVHLLGLFLLYERPGSKVCRKRSPWRLQELGLGFAVSLVRNSGFDRV